MQSEAIMKPLMMKERVGETDTLDFIMLGLKDSCVPELAETLS